MAGPLSPPLRISGSVIRLKPALVSMLPWHLKQLSANNGRMWADQRRSASGTDSAWTQAARVRQRAIESLRATSIVGRLHRKEWCGRASSGGELRIKNEELRMGRRPRFGQRQGAVRRRDACAQVEAG